MIVEKQKDRPKRGERIESAVAERSSTAAPVRHSRLRMLDSTRDAPKECGAAAEPQVSGRWSRRRRIAFLVGSSLLLWTCIIGAVLLVF